MSTQDRIERGIVQRELNQRQCSSADRFEAYARLEAYGLGAALAFVRSLPPARRTQA